MVNLKKSEKFQKKQEINAQRRVHFFPVSDISANQPVLLIDRRKQLIHIRVQIRFISIVLHAANKTNLYTYMNQLLSAINQ